MSPWDYFLTWRFSLLYLRLLEQQRLLSSSPFSNPFGQNSFLQGGKGLDDCAVRSSASLAGVRERAAEGSLLFDEAEKAHPRVLDILLQLLDAARITVATGQTLDFSGFYIWLTSNIGSAELMSLQHSNDATLERHVLTRAQQTLRPEIFARVNEKLVFHRLSYEHQLEIAEKLLAREIEFLKTRGHALELEKAVLPFLVRKGFHPKLGARPMRDAVEKLVGDAVSECLLDARPACGALAVDETRDCLTVL